MKIFDNYKAKKEAKRIEDLKRTYKNLTDAEIELMKMLGMTPNQHNLSTLNSSTYLACLKLISESIGKLPLELHQYKDGITTRNISNPKYDFLKLRPNKYTSSTLFWQQAVFSIYHYGNAYIYMDFKGYKLRGLHLLNSKYVTVMIDNVSLIDEKCKIYYQYTDPQTGKLIAFPEDNIIHLKNSVLQDNGIVGKSSAELLASYIENELERDNYMNNLVSNNMSSKSVLQYTGDLNSDAEARLITAIEEFAQGKKGTSGQILPLPLGFSLTPMNGKLVDAQFLDLGKFNTQQICNVFGISSSYLNIRDGSTSYSNSEQESLRFLQTIQFPLQMIEDEITYKILSTSEVNNGIYWEFDTNYLLRTSLKERAEILTMYTKNGILKINEAREDLGRPPVENGDVILIQGANTTLENVVKGVNYSNNNIDNEENDTDKLLEVNKDTDEEKGGD